MVKNIFYFIVGLMLIEACNVSSSSSTQYDYTYLYDENQKLISPNFKIFHHNSDSTSLFYQLRSTDILYGKVIGDSLLKARVLVKYKVYDDKNRKSIIDSATIPLTNYGGNNEDRLLQGQLLMKVPKGKVYPLEVRFRDANKDLNVVYQLQIDKRDNLNEQYFLLKEGEKVLVNPIVSEKQKITIEKSRLINESKFLLEFSTQTYSMTPPPFAENTSAAVDISVDSSKAIFFTNHKAKITSFSTINRLNISSGDLRNAFYFYYYYKGYPEITEVEQLVLPTRYISTSSEYKKIKNAVNYKKAIDAFWLGLAKDEEKAKKMIREYYKRVELSNKHFTSFKEGWKTDRGIIFIVYGIPNTIYKSTNRETWIYGEENNILSVKFEFVNTENTTSNNNYRLIRNVDYKSNWYRAVDMWRQGKVY